MYKLIAIDLDDTLLSDDLSIHPQNIKNLDLAKKEGVYVVLCSGRESASMKKIIRNLPFLENKDYYISYNGAMIQNLAGDVLWKDKIEGDAFKKFITLGRKYDDVSIQCYSESLVVDEVNERLKRYEYSTGINARVVKDLNELDFSIKILYNSVNTNRLKELKKEFEKEFGEEYHYFFSKPEYLEILNKKSNKGLAVKFLAEHLEMDASQIICIGDSFNDQYMIEYAGLGVAMQNANPKIKEIADVVTENTNNQAGVAEIVDKYILNRKES